MTEFFSSMPNDLFTFWMIAVPFTVFFVLQTALTFIGMDSGGDLDTDADVDTDSDSDSAPFQLFTLRNLVAFMTMFGWTGIVCLNSDISLGMSIFIATLSGLAMVIVLSSIFYFTSKLQSDATPNPRSAIGREGTVYLTIPGNGKLGKINVVYGGSIRTVDAISTGPEIPTGSRVKVVAENSGDLIVEAIEYAS